MARTGRLPVPGADLSFEVEGTGPAVVLVHGFSRARPRAARRNPAIASRLEHEIEPYTCFQWTEADPRAPLEPSPYAHLEQIAAPTTVVIGELDVPYFHVMADVLAGRIPGARLITVPDAGHMVNLEQPELVNALLRDAVNAAR